MYWKSIWYNLIKSIGTSGLKCKSRSTCICILLNDTEWIIFILTECIQGYLGPDCALSCPYPSYGERCQGHCNCSNTSCDVSIGCKPMGIGTLCVNVLKIYAIFYKMNGVGDLLLKH